MTNPRRIPGNLEGSYAVRTAAEKKYGKPAVQREIELRKSIGEQFVAALDETLERNRMTLTIDDVTVSEKDSDRFVEEDFGDTLLRIQREQNDLF